MVNTMTLEEITIQLTGMGFKAKSATTFNLGNVEVKVIDAFLKLKHPEMVNMPDPFFQVTVYNEGNEMCAVFICPVDSFVTFKNEMG